MVQSAENEAPPGPGYWKAPDGNWYPPEAQPAVQSAPPVVYVQQAPSNGQAVAALVCGIIGVVVGLIPILAVPALILGILAVTFGWLAWRRALKGQPRKGMAIAGTILGAVAIALSIVGFAIVNNALKSS
jgi:hypothetical protein